MAKVVAGAREEKAPEEMAAVGVGQQVQGKAGVMAVGSKAVPVVVAVERVGEKEAGAG